MTKQEQRFHAAVAAMQGFCASFNCNRDPSAKMAAMAVLHADALLAELDRTAPKPEPATYGGWGPCPECGKPTVKNPPPWGFPTMADVKDSLTAQPDADGWIPHNGGPRPCPGDMPIARKYRDGTIGDCAMTADKFYWPHDGEDFDIVAWKPAK